MRRALRFFAALFICLVPMIVVAALPQPVGPKVAGFAIIDSILLLAFLSYRVLTEKRT